MSFNIAERSIKFKFAPYLLSTQEYWNYIYTPFLHHKAWSFNFFKKYDLVLIVASVIGFWIYGQNEWTLALGIITLVVAVLDIVAAITSKTIGIRWFSLIILAVALVTFSLYLFSISAVEIAIIILYFSLSHLIALVRIRKFLKGV